MCFLPPQLKIVKLLLKHRADPSLQNEDGKSPFALATCPGVRELLLKAQNKKFTSQMSQDEDYEEEATTSSAV